MEIKEKEMKTTAEEQAIPARCVLPRIPRFPLLLQRLDDKGHLVGVEIEHPSSNLTPRVLGCLFCAFKMKEHEIAYEQISATSGEAFRFAFEENWGHEAEYITPVDALTTTCDILGFKYTSLRNQDLEVALKTIERSIARGTPVLIGMDRRWRLIVGYDKDKGEYYYIPGDAHARVVKVGGKT